MSEVSPFKFDVGEVVYCYSVRDEDLVGVKTIVIHRFVTTKGNMYTTTLKSNVLEKFLLSRAEALISTLAGKILET